MFAQIILRGGVDLLDILVGRRAAAKLAGQGLRSVGAYFGYLEKEMRLWRARQGGSGPVRQGTVAEPIPTPASTRPAAPPTQKPGKLTAGSPEHKSQRWADYQKRGGKYDYDRWSKQYDTNMQNATYGLSREAVYREEMGGISETRKTPFTNRQVDISIPERDYLGQLKTGKVSLTEQAKIDIAKDAALVRQGFEVEYILEKGASKPFLDALSKAGIKYKIGPQIPMHP